MKKPTCLFRPLIAAVAAASLTACASLPTSGPSLREVEAGAGNGIQIIDLTSTVATELADTYKPALFSDLFPEAVGDNEIVGPGDVLEVSVWEAPPAALFSSAMKDSAFATVSTMTVFPQQMVNGAGAIYIPFAGAVAAAGKTPQAIATEVAKRLQGKANAPQALVRLVANNTSYVTVVGEVANSTRMPLTARGERLLDALAAAGGTKQDIEKVTLQVTRGRTVHALPLATVIRDPRQNILLQPGDVVTALFQPLSFTALGATGKSDEVFFEAKGISLAQALARSGGLIDMRANAQGVFIFRFEARDALKWPVPAATTPEGYVPVVYRVNLKDPRSLFLAQSFRIRNNDMLYIANAPAAELQKFLNMLVSTVYPIEGAVDVTRQ
jgi:polysaccharide biosynthesis/export protein